MTTSTTLLWPADLLRAGDLPHAALDEVLGLAARMKAEPARWTGSLSGEALACVYETPTTRAGLSAQVAAHRLGLEPVVVRPRDLALAGGETLSDAAEILSGWACAIVVRDLPDLELQTMARIARVPVINGLSPEHHPCQAVADLLTLRERRRRFEGLVLAYVGVAGNIARSLMQAGATAGMTIRVASPPDDAPAPEDVSAAQLLGDLHGGRVEVHADPRDAVDGADVVYTSAWPPDIDEDTRERLRRYRVTQALLGRAKPDVVFLHSLPVHREQEVTEGVVDGPHSLVWQQAAARVPAEQAVIHALVHAARGVRDA